MKKFKKFLMVLFVILMLSPLSLEAFATDTVSSDTIKIEVTTDKSSYKPWQVAKITATVTNTGSEDLNNVIAQAVFDDLAPAGKSKSYTSKKVDVLKAGESISFTYKATLDADEHNLNIFEQIILWFVRLFNGGYTAQTADIDAITQSSTEIKFGKYFARNVIEVGYEKENINDDNTDTIIDYNSDYIDFNIETFQVDVGKQEEIIFEVEIYDEELLEIDKVELYSEDGLVGFLYDNGESPDVSINDGIYTGKFTVYSDKRKKVDYYAKVNNVESRKDSIHFSAPLSDEQKNRIQQLRDDVEEIKNIYQNDSEECVRQIISYLDTVQGITYDLTHLGIFVTFDFDCIIAIDSIGVSENSSPIGLFSNRRNVPTTQSNSKNSNIITLQPCSDSLPTTAFDEAAETVVNSEYNYTFSSNLDNEEVTFDVMKTLSQYKMVIIDGHGAKVDNRFYCMQLGERISEAKNERYQKSDDYGSTIVEGENTYFITELFFEKYYEKGDLANTLFYIGTCFGGDSNVGIRRIINEKSQGTAAVLSFKNTVVSTYNRELAGSIFESLSKGYTIGDAVIEAKKIYGEQDPYFSSSVLDFWSRVLYNLGLGFLEPRKPAELILTGDNRWSLLGDNSRVYGKLIDSSTGEAPTSLPVVNILDSNNVVVAYTSVRDGNFSLCVPAGEYTLSIECEGYNTYTAPLTIDSAQSSIDLGTIELEPVSSGGTDYSNIAIGDTITLGTYNGEPITWVCVDIDANGPLMLSEDVLCTKEYDAPGTSSTYHTDGWGYIRENYGSNCWYDSNIRQWLNSNESSVSWTHCPPSYSAEAGFMTNFTASELSLVKPVERLVNVIAYESKRSGYCEGGSKDTVVNEIYNSSFPATNYYYDYIEDSFFLLSAVQFNNIYIKNPNYLNASSKYSTCITSGNNSSCFEWVGTVEPNSTTLDISSNAWITYGIRPAFYLALNIERPSNVPEDAVYFNGHYYKTYETGTTWTDAKAYCESLGGHLATITSQEENTFISTITPNNYYFIGATDKEEEGKWQWVTGESWQYSNWDSGEPNNGLTGTSQNYSAILGQSEPDGGCWDDSWDYPGDAHSFGFICEWES